MTTDKTIEEMNTAIADFMGYIHSTDPVWDKHEMENLKYHEDWNQLHAVWDRYKKLTFADPKQEQLHSEMKSLISVAICYSDMLHVHKLLYDSIVFFTTTKQKD